MISLVNSVGRVSTGDLSCQVGHQLTLFLVVFYLGKVSQLATIYVLDTFLNVTGPESKHRGLSPKWIKSS